MGISISYHRVMELEEWITTSVCEQFEKDSVVASTGLLKALFTVCAQDNIDHNPSSTTVVNAFHGTGITLFQFPTKVNPELLLQYHLLELNSTFYLIIMSQQ